MVRLGGVRWGYSDVALLFCPKLTIDNNLNLWYTFICRAKQKVNLNRVEGRAM